MKQCPQLFVLQSVGAHGMAGLFSDVPTKGLGALGRGIHYRTYLV